MSDFTSGDLPQVSAREVADDAVMIDVREQDEWDAGHARNAVHIPLSELPSRLDDLPDTDDMVPVICRRGGRSARAVGWLVQQGFDVANVTDGMSGWDQAGKPLVSSGDEAPRVI